MTFYQELQLNQAGSKNLIKNASEKKERIYHIMVYLFKILLTMAFCMIFVIGYTQLFGEDNSITGVVVLLCVMVFRYADFGIQTREGIRILFLIFGMLAVGPRLANELNPTGGLIINLVFIGALVFLGCHNVMMANHSTLVLGYLLFYGYDVTGRAYLLRIVGLAAGAVVTAVVYYRGHHHKEYKRNIKSIREEIRLDSSRTRWQFTLTIGVATILYFFEVFHLPRGMWAGIAAMSVLLPFQSDLKDRVKKRIPGNIAGGIIFLAISLILPESFYSYIGILGGIGVGLSATYQWQAVFNSLGAMAIAVGFLGVPGAVFFRIFNNICGSVYGQMMEKTVNGLIDKTTGRSDKGKY